MELQKSRVAPVDLTVPTKCKSDGYGFGESPGMNGRAYIEAHLSRKKTAEVYGNVLKKVASAVEANQIGKKDQYNATPEKIGRLEMINLDTYEVQYVGTILLEILQ